MTPAQNAIIKADIAANADMNTLPANSDGSYAIADLYNKPAVPTYSVWRTNASVQEIIDAIDVTKYTPVDVPSASDLPAVAALFLNRAALINIKQMNLQNMLVGRESIDASRATVRAGLRDAVIQVPAGASGVATSPGGASGVNVMNACTRPATRLEKLLVTSTPATGGVTAGVMGFEGSASYQEIDQARA